MHNRSIHSRAKRACGRGARLFWGGLGAALLGSCDDPVRVEPIGDSVVARVELSAPHDALFPADTVRVTAVALSADGDALSSAPLTWTSSDTAVATVEGGLVSARRPGPVTILASSGDAQGALGLTVAADVWAVYSRPAGVEALPGKVVPLSVVNRFNSEVPVPATYSSSDTTVATVSERGEVTAKAPGIALVTIHYLTRRLEVPVRVHALAYRLTHLGDLGGGESEARGLNERGQVVGRAATADGDWQGFVWEGGTMRSIAYPGAGSTEAVAINERGVVVGNTSRNGCWGCGSWRWENGTLTPIEPNATPNTPYVVTDINDRGQVAGHEIINGRRITTGVPFVWLDGETRWIEGRGRSAAINEDGIVVGRIDYEGGSSGTGWTGEGAFHAGPPLPSPSDAHAINDHGQVVGFTVPATEDRIGIYLWTESSLSLLGQPGPGNGGAQAINNLGEIVGGTPTTGAIPFLWRNGYFVDLNNLVDDPEWTITGATDINDRGQIVGYGRHRDTGATGALLLSPQ